MSEKSAVLLEASEVGGWGGICYSSIAKVILTDTATLGWPRLGSHPQYPLVLGSLGCLPSLIRLAGSQPYKAAIFWAFTVPGRKTENMGMALTLQAGQPGLLRPLPGCGLIR